MNNDYYTMKGCRSSGCTELYVPAPQECMGRIIGTGGNNIKQLARETRTRIKTCNGDDFGKGPGFLVIGTPSDCEDAQLAIRRRIKNWEVDGVCQKSELKGDDRARKISVPKKFIHIVVGKGRKNIDGIQTKTETKIIVPSHKNTKAQDGDTVQLKIIGTPKKCDGAEARIRHCIRDFSDKTISDIKDHLMTPLQNLRMLRDEKQLMADLWCHFGKVFVSCVDEEHIQDTFTATEINTRVKKIFSQTTPHKQEIDGHWRVSFEEGINQTDINDGQLPKSVDGNHGFLGLKLVHTRWRYDFGFTTPTYRSVRLKVWEGLPPDIDEPPVEVKNILRRVFFQGMQDINAWLCYPSISVLRGEIMTPNSLYDCRMKLRAGSRYMTAKDSICIEEDDILADYISNCKLDQEKHCMRLPDEKEHEIPEGFDCVYYREAKEIMYEATVDEESFTVIVLEEQGWDSDSSERRDKKQFGIRVVMNSWSDAMLSPEQHWEPEKILQKLENYMTFLSLLQNYLFGDG